MSAPAVGSAVRPPERVLHVVSNMDRGGAETMLMNYYRRIDRSRVQFDFLAHAEREGQYDPEIRALGGRILRVRSPAVAGPLSYVRAVRRLLRVDGPFRAVHTHNDSSGALACLAGLLAGVRVRLVHAHSTAPLRSTRRTMVALEEAAMKWLIGLSATGRIACGREAAAYLFGQRVAKRADGWRLMSNALDLERFAQAWAASRDRVRETLGGQNGRMLLVHVGSFKPVKNHAFLLRLVLALKERGADFLLLLIGEGPLRAETEAVAREEGLAEHMRFLGSRSDIPSLLRAADVCLLPSLAEGLPVAILEAQAAGRPCLVSTAVTEEVDVGLGLVHRLELSAGGPAWAEACLALASPACSVNFEDVRVRFRACGLDVSRSVDDLYHVYGIASA